MCIFATPCKKRAVGEFVAYHNVQEEHFVQQLCAQRRCLLIHPLSVLVKVLAPRPRSRHQHSTVTANSSDPGWYRPDHSKFRRRINYTTRYDLVRRSHDIASPLAPLKIQIAYLNSLTPKTPPYICEKFLDFWHRIEICAIVAYSV